MLPLFYDYSFSSDGIRIKLFGFFVVAKIHQKAIKSVHVDSFWNTVFDRRGLFAFRFGNRFQRRILVVRTDGWIKHWYLTPRDPDGALKILTSK